MTNFDFNSKDLPIAILDENSGRRGMLSGALKQLGYTNLTTFSDGRDLLIQFSTVEFGWLIGTFSKDESPNLIQILALIAATPELQNTSVSMFINSEYQYGLPKAFELGLLSYHAAVFSPDQIMKELTQVKQLMSKDTNNGQDTAAEYLRSYLKDAKEFKTLLELERKLLDIEIGSKTQFLNVAKAEVLAKEVDSGLKKLNQLATSFPEMSDEINKFATYYAQNEWSARTSKPIFDDIPTHILCDEGSSARQVSAILNSVGIQSIQIFDTFKSYKNYLSSNDKPKLFIFDWDISDIENIALLQRLKGIEEFTENILIYSEIVDPSLDKKVLKELGLFGIIKLPLAKDTLAQEILRLSRELDFPGTGDGVEHKIKIAIKKGEVKKAKQLYKAAESNPKIDKKMLPYFKALVLSGMGEHNTAAKLVIQFISSSGNSIAALNLLGKCMLSLGKFDSAAECFSKANQMAPGSVDRLCNLSMASHESNNQKEAAKSLSSAADLDPDSSNVVMTQATQELRNNDIDKAKLTLKRLNSHLGVGASLNNAAIANIRANRVDEALKLYSAAEQAIPEDLSMARLSIQYNHSLALARLGKDLNKIPELLEDVIAKSKSKPLVARSKSLLKRATVAIASKTSIELFTTDQHAKIESNISDELISTKINQNTKITETPKRLLNTFKASDVVGEVKRYFEEIPKFKGKVKAAPPETPATTETPQQEAEAPHE